MELTKPFKVSIRNMLKTRFHPNAVSHVPFELREQLGCCLCERLVSDLSRCSEVLLILKYLLGSAVVD